MWPKLKEFVFALLAKLSQDNLGRMAAALTFYLALSLPAFLMLSISVAHLFVEGDLTDHIIEWILGTVLHLPRAEEVIALLSSFEQESLPIETQTPIITIVTGILFLAWLSSMAFEQLAAMHEDIFHRPHKKKPKGVWGFVWSKIHSVLVGGSFGLLLALVAVSMVIFQVSSQWLAEHGWVIGHVSGIWIWLLSWLLIAIVFAKLYWMLSGVKLKAKYLWLVALLTSLLFSLAKDLLAWYVGRMAITSLVGSAGTLLALLVWINISSQVFLIGAEVLSLLHPDEDQEKIEKA